MAPALTEAATQIRAQLPTVGHGRVDCPPTSPTQSPCQLLAPSTHSAPPLLKKSYARLTASGCLSQLQHQVLLATASSESDITGTREGGETLKEITLSRMKEQDKSAAGISRYSQSEAGVAGKIMPHPAAAPNINSKTPGMGYTYKTTSSAPQSSYQSQPLTTPSSSDIVRGTTNHSSMTSPTLGEQDAGMSLQNMDDLASITLVDLQAGCNTGMADVGLLNNVDRVGETAKRQRELESHAARLTRRIRRLQSRQSICHVQQQLSGFVDHQHRNLQTMAKAMKPQPTNNMELKAELLQSEDVKSLSTAALVSLVRRLQTSQAMTLRQRLANCNQSSSDGTSVLRLDEDLCSEMNRVSSTLQKDLKHLESALDSDATESSSGGESCDEYDYDDEKVPKTCLRRRAEWKWASKRAEVAAKWTWLQAQVSDLEYRIRQQSDIYRQIRAAKGAVVLGDPVLPEDIFARFRGAATTTPAVRSGRRLSPLEEKIANLERKNEMSPCNLSTLLSNVDKQSIRLTEQLGNVLSPAESPLLHPSTPPAKVPCVPHNGLVVSSTPGTHASDNQSSGSVADGVLSLSFDPPSPAVDTSCQAARCRPVRSYGKRKLLTTSGLYQLSRKAARLSTVPCYCYPPTTPCAMCGGRYNNRQTVQHVAMPIAERASLIDPSYHQVLSFSQDMPLPIHFESLLRCGEWQHKPLPSKPTRPLGATKGKQKAVSERKYRKNCTLLSTSSAGRKKRNTSTSSIGPTVPSPTTASPRDTPSPLSNSCLSSTLRDMKDAQRRRRGESAFDINNIVIPYSMAASTRVEKLLYKEIITPKWRKIGSRVVQSDEDALLAPQTGKPEEDSGLGHVTTTTPMPITQQLTPITPQLTPSSSTQENTPTSSESTSQPHSDTAPITLQALPETPLTPETPNSTPPSTSKASSQIDDPHRSEKAMDIDEAALDKLESTPSFKVVDCVKPTRPATPGGNGLILPCKPVDPEADFEGVQLEDLSEELIAARHMRCEIKEKKRFMSVIKKRSRSVRTDSFGTSDDSVLPIADIGPAESPVPALVPTPVVAPSTPPGTPAMAPAPQLTALLDEEMELAGERFNSGSCSSHDDIIGQRRPSMSGRLRSRGLSASFTSTSLDDEDLYESGVDPWPLRIFPLPEVDYESLFQDDTMTTAVASMTTPTETPIVSTRLSRHASTTTKGGYTYHTATPENSNPTSPIPSSSNSSVMDDDPNDPEWTVVDGIEKPATTQQPNVGIILKFSKR